ncbi:MAG: VOC family protein [Thermoplasmata archaeon]|nr:VOC family protein [Thermoplasmata archaeon]
MGVQTQPEGYHTVSPYLVVSGAGELIEFLEHTFDGEVKERITMDDGRVAHAEVRIGDSIVMMGEPTERTETQPAHMYVYVPDIDATFDRALKGGAATLMEPTDQYYGDRTAGVKDAFGNVWWLATHVEDVSPEELQRRAKELEASQE